MFEPASPARSRSVGTIAVAVTFATLLCGRSPPLHAQVVTRVSVDSAGAQANDFSDWPVISADGRFVAFASAASNLARGAPSGIWEIYVRDLANGATECVSVSTAGAVGNNYSVTPAISADGRFVAFASYATNLVAGDTDGFTDVFLRDRLNGTTERVDIPSSGKPQDGPSYVPAISADGRFVAFASSASNLVQGDNNGRDDVFVRDRAMKITERVSVASSGAEGNGSSAGPSISADGTLVAFASDANNLVNGDGNQSYDVFVHDRTSGATRRVSVSSAGVEGNYSSDGARISADGKVVAFESGSSNLVAGDTNSSFDVFVHDRSGGITERVSVDSSGAELNRYSETPSISSDGNVVAFASHATNVAPTDTNAVADVFLRDRSAGTTTLASFDCAWIAGDGESISNSISGDGLHVAFSSAATDLVDGDTNRVLDVFLNDFTAPPVDATWSNYGAGFAGTLGVPSLTASADPVFGTTITIDVGGSSGTWSVGQMLVGLNPASIPTSAGGTLLVDPMLQLLFVLLPSGQALPGYVPRDTGLCGLSLYLQVLELDAGAAKGISFTPGMQLVVGH